MAPGSTCLEPPRRLDMKGPSKGFIGDSSRTFPLVAILGLRLWVSRLKMSVYELQRLGWPFLGIFRTHINELGTLSPKPYVLARPPFGLRSGEVVLFLQIPDSGSRFRVWDLGFSLGKTPTLNPKPQTLNSKP